MVFIYYLYITMTTNKAGYMRAYYEYHKEKIQSYQRDYYKRRKAEKKANPWLLDTRVDYKTPTREDFQAIPKSISSYNKEYYEKNKERIRAQQKQKRIDDKRKVKQRAYYAEHREHICALQNKSRAEKKRKEQLSKTFWGRIKLKIEKIFG